MSDDRINLLRDGYARIENFVETGEVEFDSMAPETEFDFTQALPDQGVARGLDAFREVLSQYGSAFEEWHVEPMEFIDAGHGQMVVIVRDGGRIKGSESEIYNEFAHLWTFRDDVVIRFATFTDRAKALEAAGLSE